VSDGGTINVKDGRIIGLSLLLLLATGCGGGGGSSSASGSVAPSPATPSPTPSYPATSSAAAHLVGNVNQSPPPAPYGPTDPDDGGWSQLDLPPLTQCGDGALATDCTVWSFAVHSSTAAARSSVGMRHPRTAVVGSEPPTLNFCRNAGAYPAGLGPSAIPVNGLSGDTFSLTYSGTKQLPIVTFATRPWAASVTNSFTGTSTSAPAIDVTASLSDTPARGWLLFFTWTWPADVLLVPYQVNEIQLNAASSPLAIKPNSSARLGAFDCLGQPITATAALGSDFGFSSDLKTSSVSSTGSELDVQVYTSSAPSGSALLYDDLGATTETPVN
jgi:hypothetical protein